MSSVLHSYLQSISDHAGTMIRAIKDCDENKGDYKSAFNAARKELDTLKERLGRAVTNAYLAPLLSDVGITVSREKSRQLLADDEWRKKFLKSEQAIAKSGAGQKLVKEFLPEFLKSPDAAPRVRTVADIASALDDAFARFEKDFLAVRTTKNKKRRKQVVQAAKRQLFALQNAIWNWLLAFSNPQYGGVSVNISLHPSNM